MNHLMERFSNEKLNEIFVPESLRKLVVLKMIFKFGELPPLLECIRVRAQILHARNLDSNDRRNMQCNGWGAWSRSRSLYELAIEFWAPPCATLICDSACVIYE